MIILTLQERHNLAVYMGMFGFLVITGAILQIIIYVHCAIMKEKRDQRG